MFGEITIDVFGSLLPLYHGAEAGGFPAESIPDGSIWVAHHFWTGVWGTVFALYADRRDGRALTTVFGLLVAVYGWLFLWQNASSPLWGAIFSLFGVGIALVSVIVGTYWRNRSLREYARMVGRDLERLAEADRQTITGFIGNTGRAVRWAVTHPSDVVRAVWRAVRWFVGYRLMAFISLIIAADDAVDHATALETYLDAWYTAGGHGVFTDLTRLVIRLLTG